MKRAEQFLWSKRVAGLRAIIAAGVVLGAGAQAEALLFKPHMANHALCCGMVGAEGFPVRGSTPVPEPVVSFPNETAGMVNEGLASSQAGAPTPATTPPSKTPAPAPAPLAALPPMKEEGGALVIHFDLLAGYAVKTPEVFRATPETPIVVPEIPQMLRAVSGRTAVVQGFMLPLKLQGGRTTEFLLMRDQALCCFGRVPMLNEWVYVRMPKGTEMVKDLPVSFRGKLTVGEILDDGYLIGIYLMDAEAFVPEKS